VGQHLGRRKIFETLIELDPGAQLPYGPRMGAFIVPDGGDLAQAEPGRLRVLIHLREAAANL
jgi:hypothetical protein